MAPTTKVVVGVTLALALTSVLANGYLFGVSDHNEQLPIIKRILDPSFLQKDWFVNWNSQFNARSFYNLVLVGLSFPFRSLDAAFVVVYLAALVILCVAVCLLATAIWSDLGVGLAAALIVLYNRLGSLGASQFVIPILVPSFLAFCLVSLSAYWLYRRHYIRSTVLLALTGLLHPLIGPESAMLLGGATFLSLSQSERRGLLHRLFLFFVVTGLPAAVGFVAMSGEAIANQVDVVRILAWVRHPWHYVPSTWDQDLWINFAAFVLLVMTARARVPRSAFLDWLIVGVSGFCAFGILALVWEPLSTTVKLQPFRMTVLLQWIGALYLARYCWEWLRDRRWTSRIVGGALLVGLCLSQKLSVEFPHWLVATVVLTELIRYALGRSGYTEKLHWLLAIPALGLVVRMSTELLSVDWSALWVYIVIVGVNIATVWLSGMLAASYKRYRAVTVTSVALSMFALAILGSTWNGIGLPAWLSPVADGLEMHLEYHGDFDQLALWVRANTPHDAVFVAPPYLQSFRLMAERAIVVDFKTFPFKDQAILEWRDRIADLAGGRDLSLGYSWHSQLRGAYLSMNREQFVELARKYDADYIVVERGQDLGFPLVYRNESFHLYASDQAAVSRAYEMEKAALDRAMAAVRSSLDFSAAATERNPVFPVAGMAERATIEGAVRLAEGSGEGSKVLVVDETTRLTGPTSAIGLVQGSLSVWARLNDPKKSYSDLVRLNNSNDLYIYHLGENGRFLVLYDDVHLGITSLLIDDDQWHHYVFAWQDGEQKFYIDGVEALSSQVPACTTDTDLFAVGWLGNRDGEQWGGLLADLITFKRLLSSDEVLALYRTGPFKNK